jgi:hypothetical protein
VCLFASLQMFVSAEMSQRLSSIYGLCNSLGFGQVHAGACEQKYPRGAQRASTVYG